MTTDSRRSCWIGCRVRASYPSPQLTSDAREAVMSHWQQRLGAAQSNGAVIKTSAAMSDAVGRHVTWFQAPGGCSTTSGRTPDMMRAMFRET